MSKVIPLAKNHKNYEDVPDSLKWALPIHECLEKPEVQEASRKLKVESKLGRKRYSLPFKPPDITVVFSFLGSVIGRVVETRKY